jgi:hypothetical protein
VGGETDWPDDYIFVEIAIQGSKSFYRLGGGGGGSVTDYICRNTVKHMNSAGGSVYNGINVRK